MRRILYTAVVFYCLLFTSCGSEEEHGGRSDDYDQEIDTSFSMTSEEEVADAYEMSEEGEALSEESDESFAMDYSDGDDYTYDDEETTDEKRTGLRQKGKDVYKAAKNKVKRKINEYKDDHEYEIEEAKERSSGMKERVREKVGDWLDRAKERLEED